ncbi:hypothetical protein E9840_04220 [Tissierella creatinini]|nr:hypothetical protein E9840_04220 [Tissierella creatinini]TJX66344.1 hypothetical protein E8P77_08115 [Soehngenia saccharolytica]
MITVEEKLDMFRKIIYEDVEEEFIRRIEEIDIRNKGIIESKRVELKKAKEDLIRKEKTNAMIRRNELIAKRSQENNEKILQKRQEIFKDFLISLTKKAIAFCHSDSYKDYFLNQLKDRLDGIEDYEIVLNISKDDYLNLSHDISKIGKLKNKELIIEAIANEDIIGGFIISDKDKSYNYNYSIKSMIEENEYEIGRNLFLALEKKGDQIE